MSGVVKRGGVRGKRGVSGWHIIKANRTGLYVNVHVHKILEHIALTTAPRCTYPILSSSSLASLLDSSSHLPDLFPHLPSGASSSTSQTEGEPSPLPQSQGARIHLQATQLVLVVSCGGERDYGVEMEGWFRWRVCVLVGFGDYFPPTPGVHDRIGNGVEGNGLEGKGGPLPVEGRPP